MRRKIVTHPAYQKSFALSFAYGLAISISILFIAFVAPVLIGSAVLTLTEGQAAFMRSESLILMATLLGVGAILGGGLYFLGLYLSYKFIGPLKRFEHWLEEALDGKVDPDFLLRHRDELGPIAVLTQSMLKIKDRPVDE